MSAPDTMLESGKSSWEDSAGDQHQPVPLHTSAELEAMVNKRVMEDCKVDTCVDWFLKRLSEIRPPTDRWGYDSLPDPTTFEGDDAEKYRMISIELRAHLDRLLPGYLGNDGIDILAHEKLRRKLDQRWGPRVRKLFNTDGQSSSDSFRHSLLQTLMEQHYRCCAQNGPSTPSLAHAAEVEVLRQLRHRIEGEAASTSFACGGSIPIIADSGVMASTRSTAEPWRGSAPVNIHWAVGDDACGRKLVLPLTQDKIESSQAALEQLVKDCSPATFGRGQQEVLDTGYRKAGKMDSWCFATSFHPANFGIIDNIERILLPSLCTEGQSMRGARKLWAELYKLNVYSGPSGLFRPHVDTPRSEHQIGSLVVCLPAQFNGGVFTVRHHGQEMEFDWCSQSDTAIQWAAFYSDCEHEIQTVTAGERITLTYNLYVSKPAGRIGGTSGIIQPESLPLYGVLRDVISEPGFMRDGGVLGIYCSHAYAHSSEVAQLQLPRALKGVDLVLYSVLQALGMNVDVLPVLEYCGRYGSRNPELGIEGTVQGTQKHYFSTWGGSATREWYNFMKTGTQPHDIQYSEFIPKHIERSTDDLDQYWKLLMMSRRVRGISDAVKRAAYHGGTAIPGGAYASDAARVGTRRREYRVTDRGMEEELDDVSMDVWPAYYLPGIVWITEPKHEEMAFSQISYGNEPSIGARYSCAAILAVIPPFHERIQKF